MEQSGNRRPEKVISKGMGPTDFGGSLIEQIHEREGSLMAAACDRKSG
jgi:hypothetical protein